MNLFKMEFPAGSVVSTSAAEGRVVVSVNSPRPFPEWLRKSKTGLPGNTLMTEVEIDSAMLALVGAQPGRSRSHYTQLSREQGGFGASQQRKEAALTRLLLTGQVFAHKLEKAKGRQTHGLWLSR